MIAFYMYEILYWCPVEDKNLKETMQKIDELSQSTALSILEHLELDNITIEDIKKVS